MLKLYKLPIQEILYAGKRVTLEFILFKAREMFGPIFRPICALISVLGLNGLQLNINLHDIMIVVAKKRR